MGCAQSKTEDTIVTTTTNAPEVETVEENAVETVAVPPETEPVVAEQPKVEETAVAESAAADEESTVQPEAEKSTAKEPVNEVYKIADHEIDTAGVVFYTVESVNGGVSLKKRFSEFKVLISELGSPKTLPALPSSGLGAKLRGKHNPDLIKERETQLAVVLNAIANDADLAEKEAFKNFVQ